MAKLLPKNLTQLANDAQHDPEAARQFLSSVYEILREIAHKKVGSGSAEGATEVANEVAADMLKPGAPIVYANRQHVFGGLVTRKSVAPSAAGRCRMCRLILPLRWGCPAPRTTRLR